MAAKYGLKYLTRLFEDWGPSQPAELASRVLARPTQFPRLNTWLSIQSLPAYRYRALGENKDEGDLFDLRQMLYLVDMDVYVTNEKRLPSWYGDVFGSSRRVMTAEAFLATDWC